MTPVRVVAVNAGLGDPSSTRLLVDRLAESLTDVLAAHQIPVDLRVIDLRDLAVDIARSLATGFPSPLVRDALDAVTGADGLIAATPVFNASYNGLFKSFFDLVEVDRMQGTPVLIAATGGSPRHSMVLDHALRPMFGYLRAVVMPTGVYAAAEDWAGSSGDTATLTDRIRRAATELAGAIRPTSASDPVPAVADSATEEQQYRESVEAAGIANFARLLGGAD